MNTGNVSRVNGVGVGRVTRGADPRAVVTKGLRLGVPSVTHRSSPSYQRHVEEVARAKRELQKDASGRGYGECGRLFMLCNVAGGKFTTGFHYKDGKTVDQYCACQLPLEEVDPESGRDGFCLTKEEATKEAKDVTCEAGMIKALKCEITGKGLESGKDCWECWYKCEKAELDDDAGTYKPAWP